MSPEEQKAKMNAPLIAEVHAKRTEAQALIDYFSENFNNDESKEVVVRLKDSKMWMGQLLGALGSQLPAQYADPAKPKDDTPPPKPKDDEKSE